MGTVVSHLILLIRISRDWEGSIQCLAEAAGCLEEAVSQGPEFRREAHLLAFLLDPAQAAARL